jgi:hypothetical protein
LQTQAAPRSQSLSGWFNAPRLSKPQDIRLQLGWPSEFFETANVRAY